MVKVDTVGIWDDELSYHSQFNENVQPFLLVRRIRSVVETAAQEFKKEMLHFPREMIPVGKITSDEIYGIVDKLREEHRR